MISFLQPYFGIGKAVLLAGLALVLFAGGVKVGADHVQAKWDGERAANATAAIRAVDQRITENEIEREKNRENNRLIQHVHDAELDRVRAAVSNASRLRPGAGICGVAAGSAEAGSAGGGDGADPGGWMVREDVGRDLDALKFRVEEALAVGRSCQKFIADNGMVP